MIRRLVQTGVQGICSSFNHSVTSTSSAPCMILGFPTQSHTHFFFVRLMYFRKQHTVKNMSLPLVAGSSEARALLCICI